MNKRFSTLLAAVLVAGSFGSTYAQLNGREIEWDAVKAGRAYYLAGVHYVNPTNYLQAVSLSGIVVNAGGSATEDNVITAENPVPDAQWVVETKKVGTVTQYAFKSIKDDQYLAFQKQNDGTYVLAARKEANDETKSFRWFTVESSTNWSDRLQAVLPSEKEPLFLGLKSDANASGGMCLALIKENEYNTTTAIIKKNFALYEIYNTQVSATDFASKHGDNFTLEFPETLDDMDVFENVSVEATGSAGGFYLVDDKGTKETKDDEYVVLTNTRVSNSELATNTAIGYRYDRMTKEEFDKAVKDTKIVEANRVFYAEQSYNLPEDAYAIVQKAVTVASGNVANADVTFGKVTNDETVRQLASVEYDMHSEFMAITIGKGTRVANTQVANERKLIVNVTAKVTDKKNPSALGLKTDYTGAQWYDRVSDADFDQPQGQWLVAAGTDDNTIKLINVQKPAYTMDNIRLYEAEGENTYTVFASDLGLTNAETITLTKVEDYDQLNGYYNALSDIDQKFAFVTSGIYANEGDEDVDLYLKATSLNKQATVAPHAGSEWELIRAEEANAVVVPSYSYYDAEEEAWIKMESKNLTTDLGTAADGANFPSDTLRLAYTYVLNTTAEINNKPVDVTFGSRWYVVNAETQTTPPTSFYLKENGDGTYAIVDVTEYGKLTGKDSNIKLNNTLASSGDFTEATPFEIVDLDAAPSLAADSKHMTMDAANGTGFITTDENNSAILSQTSAALWVDSVNVEGYATPKFFVSLAGKMMTTGTTVSAAADEAYELDLIDKKTAEAIKENCTYGTDEITRVKFMTAERVAGEDTLMIGDEKYAGEDIDAFKFKITENENGEYILKNVVGGYVKVINGNLVLSDDVEDAEAFIIEQTEAPTANDEISASEVKVFAGNGQITINGAAGKKVVVSNILGQVVANTVLTSDNATIAAPQGIVVIAVEGEEAVKAIVK